MGAHSILPLAGIWICPHHPESDNDDVCVFEGEVRTVERCHQCDKGYL